MIRLFANILAGHIVILSVISMIFIFAGLSKVAGWGFRTCIYGVLYLHVLPGVVGSCYTGVHLH